jgi:hypothetical protein
MWVSNEEGRKVGRQDDCGSVLGLSRNILWKCVSLYKLEAEADRMR